MKARIYSIEASLKEQYANTVAKSENEQPLALDEWRTLLAAHENYLAAFQRSGVEDFARSEYDGFISKLEDIANGKAKDLVGKFQAFE